MIHPIAQLLADAVANSEDYSDQDMSELIDNLERITDANDPQAIIWMTEALQIVSAY